MCSTLFYAISDIHKICNFVIFSVDHFWNPGTFYLPSSIAAGHLWFFCIPTAHIVKPGSVLVCGEYPENQISHKLLTTLVVTVGGARLGPSLVLLTKY